MPTTADWYAPLMNEIRSRYSSTVHNVDSVNTHSYTFSTVNSKDYFQYLTILSGGNEYLIYLRQSRQTIYQGNYSPTVYLGCIALSSGLRLWEKILTGPSTSFFGEITWGKKIQAGPLWIHEQFGDQYSVSVYDYLVSVSPKGIAFYDGNIYFIYTKIAMGRGFTIANPQNDWYIIHHWQSDIQRPEPVYYPLIEYCLEKYDINGNKIGEINPGGSFYPVWGKYGDPFPNTTDWLITPTYELQSGVFFSLAGKGTSYTWEQVWWDDSVAEDVDTSDYLFTPWFLDNHKTSYDSIFNHQILDRYTIKNSTMYMVTSLHGSGIRNKGTGDAYWGSPGDLYYTDSILLSNIVKLSLIDGSFICKILPNYEEYDYVTQTGNTDEYFLTDGPVVFSESVIFSMSKPHHYTDEKDYYPFGMVSFNISTLEKIWETSVEVFKTGVSVDYIKGKFVIHNAVNNSSATPVNTLTTTRIHQSGSDNWTHHTFDRYIKIIDISTGAEVYSKQLNTIEIAGLIDVEDLISDVCEYPEGDHRILLYIDDDQKLNSTVEVEHTYPDRVWSLAGSYKGPILCCADGIFVTNGTGLSHVSRMGSILFTSTVNTTKIAEVFSNSYVIARDGLTGRKFAWYGLAIPTFYFVESIPVDAQTNVAVDTLISMTFNGKVNGYLDTTTANNSSMNLSYPSALVANYYNLGLADKTDVIQPVYKLPYSTIITMNLSTDLKNTSGDSLDKNYSFSFTTEAESTPEPQPEPAGSAGFMNGLLYGTIEYVPIRMEEYKEFDITEILKLVS